MKKNNKNSCSSNYYNCISLYSLLLGFWLFFFPESPKFLIECGESDEALEILKDIYQQNTGNDRSEYPVSFIYLRKQLSSIEIT